MLRTAKKNSGPIPQSKASRIESPSMWDGESCLGPARRIGLRSSMVLVLDKALVSDKALDLDKVLTNH